MMFQGRSVLLAVWGVVPSPTSRQLSSPPIWSWRRLFGRQDPKGPAGVPRLPVAGPDPKADRKQL